MKKEKLLKMLWVEAKRISKQKRFKGAINDYVDKATLRWLHEMRKQRPRISEKLRKFASLLDNDFKTNNDGFPSFVNITGLFHHG